LAYSQQCANRFLRLYGSRGSIRQLLQDGDRSFGRDFFKDLDCTETARDFRSGQGAAFAFENRLDSAAGFDARRVLKRLPKYGFSIAAMSRKFPRSPFTFVKSVCVQVSYEMAKLCIGHLWNLGKRSFKKARVDSGAETSVHRAACARPASSSFNSVQSCSRRVWSKVRGSAFFA
jgi:hypothetical protein